MISKNDVGKRIGVLRKRMGYTQAELAEKLNVSAQAVSKWETGISLPDIDMLLTISWISKTSLNSILEGADYLETNNIIDRGLLRLSRHLMCPKCKGKLKINPQNSVMECDIGHQYNIVDGVVDFGSREILGEEWSQSLRNYDQYLSDQNRYKNSNYERGQNQADVIWQELENIRPKLVLDMACGTGQGIKHLIKRINWPMLLVMVDLSHRVLAWNKLYYSSEWRNPFIDIVYLACDGSNLPILNDSIDVVFSYGGYESMQSKMASGFSEAFRILKSDGHSIYTKSIIDDYRTDNSRKWMSLLAAVTKGEHLSSFMEMIHDVNQWLCFCKKTGFIDNRYVKLYGELPAPDAKTFPFENEIFQWMAEYVFNSRKP